MLVIADGYEALGKIIPIGGSSDEERFLQIFAMASGIIDVCNLSSYHGRLHLQFVNLRASVCVCWGWGRGDSITTLPSSNVYIPSLDNTTHHSRLKSVV